MMEPLTTTLQTSENQDVLRHVHGLSAHSDIAGPLFSAVRALPGADCYTPDGSRFAYVVAYVDDRIFAFAEGMHGLTLRIPPDSRNTARTSGAAASTLGGDWWFFPLFSGGHDVERIDTWIARAYAYALREHRGVE